MRFATETSAGACVYRLKDRPEVLLVRPRKDQDSWGIPKGHVEDDENFSQAAIREVREETGIDIVIEDALKPVYARYNRKPKRVIAFLARQSGTTEAHPADGENFDVRWFDYEDLPPLHFYQQPLLWSVQHFLRFKSTGAIPQNVMVHFDIVYSYAHMLDDWIEIKKLIVAQCSPTYRKLFSRRHEISLLQQTNSFERALGALWSERTGRPIRWPKVHVDAI